VCADGQRFFFLSTRPQPGQEEKSGWVYQDIWAMDREGDVWSEPINLGEAVNQPDGREWSASLSPDGKYLFFMSSRTTTEAGLPLTGRTMNELLEISAQPGQDSSDIWWVSTEIIERLRP
jgi:Tol biopolymer transport system component